MNNEKGFTLIELIISISIISLIALGMSRLITSAVTAYNINNEINESISRSNVFLHRLEAKLTESIEKSGKIYYPKILNADFVNGNFFEMQYVAKDGDPKAGDKFAYNEDGNYNITENGNVILRSNYENDKPSNINVVNAKFHFFSTDNSYKTKIENISPGAIDFVRVELKLQGVNEGSEYDVSTGIRIRQK